MISEICARLAHLAAKLRANSHFARRTFKRLLRVHLTQAARKLAVVAKIAGSFLKPRDVAQSD